jgi:hypothetical protein
VAAQGLPRGDIGFDYTDAATGAQKAVFDLAWPNGLQSGFSGPVAVVLNEPREVLALASAAGYRCFTSLPELRAYITNEILRLEAA